MNICGKLVDIHSRLIYSANIGFRNGVIENIQKTNNNEESYNEESYILPGLIDAHVHIESSMVTPGAFAVAAVSHGTVCVVSDPHEIANVMGMEGVEFMIKDGEKAPMKFWFGAPSCVPATNFETNGAEIGTAEIENLLNNENIKYLAEMMNFPGVIAGEKNIIEKINIAKRLNKKIDGHAPGLRGEMLKKYVNTGISTDHECNSLEEAKEKIFLGMKIIIREGSAAKNLDVLKELYNTNPEEIMLCSDDIHPEMLNKRHINKLIARLISEGYDLFDVIRSATVNPSDHYGLNAGLLQPGQPADFIVVDELKEMNIIETWINGKKIFDRKKILFDYIPGKAINNFNCLPITEAALAVKNSGGKIRVLQAFDKELFTKKVVWNSGDNMFLTPAIDSDILKIVVKDRYRDAPPAIGFIKGFNLKTGAFASSVAHDSHNIIAVGTNDKDIIRAINEIIRNKGGLAVAANNSTDSLQLNIAGIMSDRPCSEIGYEYEKLSALVKTMGCEMAAPFMTLSFMALLVIPELKISDRGLFDGEKFCHVPLFVE